jgi:hypothetical protein
MRGAKLPFLQYIFMAWCLVKQRDNFTLATLLPSVQLTLLSHVSHTTENSENGDIVYYREACCFSRGQVLQRSLSLLEEIKVFFIVNRTTKRSLWRLKLGMWSVLDRHLWSFEWPNSNLQGKYRTVYEFWNKVSAFLKLLSLFRSRVLNNNTGHFLKCQKNVQNTKRIVVSVSDALNRFSS